jgi:hypothetical protein
MSSVSTIDAPTYKDVEDILNAAVLDLQTRYKHLPRLYNELLAQYRHGLHVCHERDQEAFEILLARLRGERRVFDAYNKHRLGQVAFRNHKDILAPPGAEQRINALDEDIVEDLESFPLRLEVVVGGFPELTQGIRPIYPFDDAQEEIAHAPTLTPKNQNKPATIKSDKSVSRGAQAKSARETYDKLHGAPPPNLDFPVGNITLAELAAFLPESIKSWDMIDRYCGNGGGQTAYAAMINHFRVMDRGRILPNSVYRMLKGSMDRRAKLEPGYQTWTTGIHQQFHTPQGFDHSSVSVTGFRTPTAGKKGTTADPIPIKDLAIGVKTFPTGDDALDLTRAVRYCQKHPDEVWMYPTDYERLVRQLAQESPSNKRPAGPARVQPGHQDRAVISRYTPRQLAVGAHIIAHQKLDFHGRLLKAEIDSESEATNTGSQDDSEGERDFDSLNRTHVKRTVVEDLDHRDEDEEESPSQKQANKRRNLTAKSLHKTTNKRKGVSEDSDSAEVTPSRKQPNKRTKLASEPRMPCKSSDHTSQSSRGQTSEDTDSDSDSDTFQGPKKTKKAKQLRRSTRATKVIKSYNLATMGTFKDEEEE